jgi:thioredoxin reductase (NADPH)
VTVTDLTVVGGGPAGLATAIAACRAGLGVVLVEPVALGGQLVNAATLEDLDVEGSSTGWDLAADLADRAQDAGATILFAAASSVVEDGGLVVRGTNLEVRSAAVVLATGTRTDALAVPGADRFAGLGLSECAACDGPLFAGATVVVVGGGELARWEATHLADTSAHVVVLAPTVGWGAARGLPGNVEVVAGATLVSIEGAGRVESVRYADRDGRTDELAVAAVFNATGRSPAPAVADVVLDANGSIMVGADLATSVPGCFAAGDVRAGAAGRVAEALADGERATASVTAYLA